MSVKVKFLNREATFQDWCKNRRWLRISPWEQSAGDYAIIVNREECAIKMKRCKQSNHTESLRKKKLLYINSTAIKSFEWKVFSNANSRDKNKPNSVATSIIFRSHCAQREEQHTFWNMKMAVWIFENSGHIAVFAVKINCCSPHVYI